MLEYVYLEEGESLQVMQDFPIIVTNATFFWTTFVLEFFRSKPNGTVKKLWAYNESTRKESSEGSTKTTACRGSPEKVAFSTLSLGTISEHKVGCKDIEDWLKKEPGLRHHAVEAARKGNLFIIHCAIMAQKLVITEGKEKSAVKEKVYTPVAGANQSQEIVGFPIAFKLGKIQISEYGKTIIGVQAYSWKS